MLLLGLLLMAATAAFTGLVIADNISGGPNYSVSVLGNHIATMNTLAAFLAGLALALIFCLGLAMLSTGGALMRRRRSNLRAARNEAAGAAAERDAMAARRRQDATAPYQGVDDGTGGASRAEPVGTGRHGGTRHRRHLFGH
ncbi:hypothetical protein K7472_00535 [Streptomyces sp. PTM05]|uniref:Uncharacterized protein n=1 Tax=Streptantibioticus parmotrematis TaxID=2873249 RepID=A0ABS7QJI3_9ACTN|nr:hypothetical protein [Streptantibioticus parmotrematis]MBY8883332.1 hypothetical protein [Streptantibioticus parmotrematis]